MLSCNSINVLSGQFQKSSCPFLPHTSKSTNFIANSETLNGHVMANDELERFSSGRVFSLPCIFNGSVPLFYFSICTILVYRFNTTIYSSELQIFVAQKDGPKLTTTKIYFRWQMVSVSLPWCGKVEYGYIARHGH